MTTSNLSNVDATVKQACEELIKKYNLAIESLTEAQMAEALRQAVLSGDFQRIICADGQAVNYIPYREVEKWKNLYFDLINEVATKYVGETRHETARRYIHEREHQDCSPAQTGNTR